MRRVLLATVLVVSLGLAAVLLGARPSEAAVLPDGFIDSKVAGIPAPTSMAFTPDGRLLVTTQPGKLRVIDRNGALLPTPALDLGTRVCSNSERGLLGVAVDPDFATNKYIYVYYTFNKHNVCPTGQPTNPNNPVNRVVRYTLSDGNTTAFSKLLIDNVPSPNGNHNAGDLRFGKDGLLYVSIGDGACDYTGNSGCAGTNDASRDQNILLGKILRIDRDGGIPSTNPYRGTDSARCALSGRTTVGKKCQETYAWGLRNPFRIAFDPNASGTRFFINDVGQTIWEEIDEGRAAADYGWNAREGHCATGSRTNCGPPPAGMTNPIHDYDHNTGCSAITGGAFVPKGVWPVAYDGSYLFADYVCGKIFKLTPKAGGGFSKTTFVSGLGSSSAVGMTFGPYKAGQALYYTTYENGGEIRRLAHTSTNRAPTAAVNADQTSGPIPLAVNFDGGGSSDPDGDALTYLWDFGDGTTAETATATMSHTYAEKPPEPYAATLRVRDARGAVSDPATVRIDPGNTAPTPLIDAPTADTRFRVGQEILLQGGATDAEDGALSDASLSWEVLQHHGASHTHPFLPPTTGNGIPISAPAPEDLASTQDSYLEVRLTATDSRGLKTTVTRELRPNLVDVSFATDPGGLKVRVNGDELTAPRTITSWEGYELNVEVPEQVDAEGRTQGFDSWSDGGAAAHKVTTPAAPSSLTASFKALPPKPTTLEVSSASPNPVAYNGSSTITGTFSTSSANVPEKDLTLWRSGDDGATWKQTGTVSYDPATGRYEANTGPLTANALFQVRFAGDLSYEPSTSRSVAVGTRVYLSKVSGPLTVVRGDPFTVYGYLKPYHDGTTRLDFYRYTSSGWRFYRSVEAPNSAYEGFTRYSARLKLPYSGRWYVKAYHADAEHAPTFSPVKQFTVR